jgi:uncharacterized protein (TIGR02246 family)
MKRLVIAAALVAGIVSNAFAKDADILREAKDRAEIQQLLWNYCRALDSLNEDAYADVFTPDGQFGSGERAAKGREALKKVVADVKKGRAEREAKGEPKTPAMYHVITNQHIEFVDKDHARHYSYWMTAFASGGKEVPPRVAAVGRSVDDLVRVNGKWLIRLRDVAPQD